MPGCENYFACKRTIEKSRAETTAQDISIT